MESEITTAKHGGGNAQGLLAVSSGEWLDSDCITAAASSDAGASQRRHGCDDSSPARKEVFSSGGGTQSACIAALIVQGRLPKPDYVVIADTEREHPDVWKYLDGVIRPALQSVGLEVHRVRNSEWAMIPEHGIDYLTHDGTALGLPVFTNQSGRIGKLHGFCSRRWKIEVVDRYLSKVFGVTRSKYRKWIGFSLDEGSRYTRMKLSPEGVKNLVRFPLIEDVPLRRRDAIRLVEEMGWPTPPRSACWMCPHHTDHEWRELLEKQPELFAKAVELDREIRKIDAHAFLHGSCKPLGEVDFTRADDLFSGDRCNSGACFV